MAIRAEYIWIDGTQPLPYVRSKTKILESGTTEFPIWGFDGSSTNQAPGDNSEASALAGPIETLHPRAVFLTNDEDALHRLSRAALVETYEKYADQEPIFGIEQEYTFFKENRPLGWPIEGYPAPQGPYYCGVGAIEIAGRDIVEDHTQACIDAGLDISGTNAEVMLGQWEFQVGPVDPVAVSDHLWVARYLLYRIAENYRVDASIAAKPIKGDWNGAGAHTNFSTNAMRENYDAVIVACESLGAEGKPEEHIKGYGLGSEERLTGLHETQRYDQFSYGVSDRGASVRIPWQVHLDGKGYIEDRRPNANMDPYVVTRLITNTCCEALAG